MSALEIDRDHHLQRDFREKKRHIEKEGKREKKRERERE
jgi:hypothetical protein